jgi:hypothetical protein
MKVTISLVNTPEGLWRYEIPTFTTYAVITRATAKDALLAGSEALVRYARHLNDSWEPI